MSSKMVFRSAGGVLIPACPLAKDFVESNKGDVFISSSGKRNTAFHRKAFALVKFAFDSWNPELIDGAQKNFDRFREEITILAGFYDTVYSFEGSFRLIPKSWSFGKMSHEEFSEMYKKILDVVWSRIFSDSMTKDQVERIVNNLLSFEG